LILKIYLILFFLSTAHARCRVPVVTLWKVVLITNNKMSSGNEAPTAARFNQGNGRAGLMN
jgi:hypothetical protein